MKIGLVLGKFYPLHKGHIALMHFAYSRCDVLNVLVCASEKEAIAGEKRLVWLKETIKLEGFETAQIVVKLLEYKESDLPNTSVSSKKVSKIWSTKLESLFPKIDVVFTSEPYGEYLAEFLECEHKMYDAPRNEHPVSASLIRESPFKYWDFLAKSAKPYFVKKVVLLGTESTGKSILTKNLAAYFNTVYVEEVGREVVPQTEVYTKENLCEIAHLHAEQILQKSKTAIKLLLIDTDIHITKSYSQFLFKHALQVETWVEEANKADLYLYLESDAPFVQDGTRLEMQERNLLDVSHKMILKEHDIPYKSIGGGWQNRFQKAVELIQGEFNL